MGGCAEQLLSCNGGSAFLLWLWPAVVSCPGMLVVAAVRGHQVQGAFVMGLGYMLTEEYEYDPTTGKVSAQS